MQGDTLASALYAAGVRVFSRSIKYHRPRGLYSLDGVSANCLMQVDGLPNVPAETTLLREGMRIKPQNVIGTPEFDLLGFMDRLSPLMPAGFYYHCMHKPYRLWPLFRRLVRKLAGTGVLGADFSIKGVYDEIYPAADICVIGGGPAGMSAAKAAAARGLRVVLLEARPWLGGVMDRRTAAYAPGIPLYERVRELSRQIEQMPNIRIFRQTTLIGSYINNLITATQAGGPSDFFAERYIEIRAQSVVVATGCIERPLLFEHNDRPGIMQPGCAHRLVRTYGILPGKQAVVSIGDDLGLETALDLAGHGIAIPAVADIRPEGQDQSLVEALQQKKIPLLRGWAAVRALGTKQVSGVILGSLKGGQRQKSGCDLLLASAGMTPLLGPLTLAGAGSAFDPHTRSFLPVKIPPNMHAAGRLLGHNHCRSIEASGELAGLKAAADCGLGVDTELQAAQKKLAQLPGPARGAAAVQAPVQGKKAFVCFDEDTTIEHVDQALARGFDVPELAKRYTAAGTGAGQGGISGHNLPLLIARRHAGAAERIRPTTVRAPLAPTLLATYAGAKHDMYKRTPLYASQAQAGGIFQRVGVWERVRYFSKDFYARAEIEAVRNSVGIIDVSTLGKFRIFGPDAVKALQRVYVGDMARIPQGRLKYAAMCNDDGCLLDDGLIVCRGANDYYFTTSTARAGSTIEWIRYHTRHDGWNFHLVNLSDAFGAINLAGPNARRVLAKLTAEDVSAEAFAYMGYREMTLGGAIAARVLRLGFVGELSYEIHVPACFTQSLWDILLDTGKPFGLRPFGLEAQNALRLEKGHVIIGQETEIRTTLHDLGLGFLWFRPKPEAKTVGAVALKQTENQKGRLKLVGIRMEDPKRPPKDGSIIVDGKIRGYVCTARYSFTLQQAIGLALLEAPLAVPGKRLTLYEDGGGAGRMYASVVKTPFYDPEGKRLRL